MKSKHKAGSSDNKYKNRKKIFIAITAFVLLAIGVEIIIYALNDKDYNNKHVSVAVCGAVNSPGVYSLPVNSSIGELVSKAKGFALNANMHNVDIEKILKKDSVYLIPFNRNKSDVMRAEVIDEMPTLEIAKKANKGESINFLFVGLPALYFLINYNTETNKTLVTYIPHSSLFLDNEYRLIDVYLTLGRSYAVDLLQKSLGIKIDYYFEQDRASFIRIVNELDGLDIELDEWFAEEYHMKPGMHNLNGFYSYEYVRYIQKKTKRTILKGDRLELAYNLRQKRMKQVIKAMLIKFKKSGAGDMIRTVASVMLGNNSDTNIDIKAITKLIRQVSDKPELSFQTIKGYYIKKNTNLYYIPTEWNYNQLRRKEVLDNFNVIKAKSKQELY